MTQTPPSVEITRDFHAQPERVYQGLHRLGRVAEWYGPVGFPIRREAVEFDARVGGRHAFAMVSETDSSMRTGVDTSGSRRSFRMSRSRVAGAV
jgi:uncharacterized protein YndB with AHSA1/START domain